MRTITDYPGIKEILDDAGRKVEEIIGMPVLVNYRLTIYKIAMDDLKNAVCMATGFTWAKIIEENRKRELVMARQLFCWFGFHWAKISLADLAKEIQRKDHSTSIHARDTIQNLIDVNDPEVMPVFSKLENLLTKK